MDMTETIVPRSDQLNAEDLLTGPRTVTIKEVRRGSAEQPVDVVLVEFDRPFKPSKTVRRIMVAAWGQEAANYVGHRMTLYRDPEVKWAGESIGGIRVSHMSHLKDNRPLSVALTVTRGKRAPYVVKPLADEPRPAPSLKAQVWERSSAIEPDLSDDERKTWIKGELANLGGDTPENLQALLKSWGTDA